MIHARIISNCTISREKIYTYVLIPIPILKIKKNPRVVYYQGVKDQTFSIVIS